MPTQATAQRRPPPKSADEFEDLVKDVARVRFGCQTLSRLGRRGQDQHGVDGLDVTAASGHGVVWQATLQRVRILQKLTKDLATLDASNLFQQPRIFVLALGIERDAKIQLAVSELSAMRLRAQKCAVDVWFWEDLYDVVLANQTLHRQYFPQDARPLRVPTLSLEWVPHEEKVPRSVRDKDDEDGKESEGRKIPARIDTAILEIPVVSTALEHIRRVLSAEIADCNGLLEPGKAPAYAAALKKYRDRCSHFLSVVYDDPSFSEWYVREHWKTHSRWFALRVANAGTALATGVHATLVPGAHLRFYSEEPKTLGPHFPSRPDFALDWLRRAEGKTGSPTLVLPKHIISFVSPRWDGADARLDGGNIDLHLRALPHQHNLDLADCFAALALPGSGGMHKISYKIFSLEGTEWEENQLDVRIVPETATRFGYAVPLRDIGLDVSRTKVGDVP